MRSIQDHSYRQRGAPLDDAAMEQHVRALAVSLQPSGRTAIKAPSLHSICVPLAAARALSDDQDVLPVSLEWILENGRSVEMFARSLYPRSSVRLCGAGGIPRIQRLTECLIARSDAAVSEDRLCACLAAFDEVRALTMDEWWAIPAALTAALCREYIHAAARALQARRDQRSALRWLAEGAPISPALLRRSSAFFECALRRMHEEDMPAKYREVTLWLASHDRHAERLIAMEHEHQALNRLILGNILSTLRMLTALDWSACFRRLNPTEQVLLADPSETYGRMEEASCAQVRQRCAYIARRCGVEEITAARCAREAASQSEGTEREICWWLYTDSGNRALLEHMRMRAALRPLVPDPNGRRYLVGIALFALALWGAALCAMGWLPSLVALPILLGASSCVVNRLCVLAHRPRPLLKLKSETIPDDCATLLVMPALLSSPEQSRTLCDQLEALGCLETDENLSFLLLGDLCDHTEAHRSDDAEIIQTAQTCIDEANRRAGREKYYFLHRERVLQPCEGRFMGRERKRGALNALNRLLLHGESEFVQPWAHVLQGRFPFVLTIDAGTAMLPGTAHRLVGTLAHPLNRLHREKGGALSGYALLAPRMELSACSVVNRFIRLYGGRGGVDTYPTSVSDVYQDLCAQGNFGGKGIYDVEAFEHAVRGKLPDNAILSHDLIEGILSRAGFVSDIALYEGHPKTVKSYFMRLNRWTRGDWQLLPLLFRRSLALKALDRHKIADNLRRSIEPLCQMILFYLGFYTRSCLPILTALLPTILPMFVHLSFRRSDWMRLLVRLSLLPQEAHCLLSGIVRSLWRMTVSKRHLLEWVTADDADKRGGRLSPAPGWIASVLLLPALIAPAPWLLSDVLLAALWWTAGTLIETLEESTDAAPEFDRGERALLMDLARRTFRFFADNVSDTGLPPDNVQLDPDNGAAKRTSPTNIGLYMASCTAARELGLISAEEMTARLSQTLHSLERMEKHLGQLYNWYDPETLRPLRPRYVSSVDSGNLAACMLLCARALAREGSTDLAERTEALVRDMDFRALFDEERKLFVIGLDAENNRPSQSHYDLLASESRILSFTALMLGQVPLAHWKHLGRGTTPLGSGMALLSWSGTLFEYLMPQLFLPLCPDTLLHQTHSAVVAAQRTYAQKEHPDLPWGISESGYYAFDSALNYQYRAFGLKDAALSADTTSQVIAPYASMLALSTHPDAVLDNLRRMIQLDMMDDRGLFEAADCDAERIPEGASHRIVKSHMAHHQGMILCAICNALTDQALVRLFFDRPQARALELLLQEKPAPRTPFTHRPPKAPPAGKSRSIPQISRNAHADKSIPDTHLLCGLNTTAALSADGSLFVRKGGILLNRRQSDPSMPPQGIFVHAHDRTHGEHLLLSGASPKSKTRIRFEAGSAIWQVKTKHLDSRLRAFVSPEDGAFLQHIRLTNCTDEPISLDVTACFQVALAREADYEAHPVFQNLFIESRLAAPNVLCFRRRPRTAAEYTPLLVHALAGVQPDELSRITYETDLMKLTGRERLMHDADALPDELSGTLGHVLTPCSALRLHLTLEARTTREICFSVGLADEDGLDSFIERRTDLRNSRRAWELSCTQAREQLRYLNLPVNLYHLLQRSAALLLYPRLHGRTLNAPPAEDRKKEGLWSMGISGDLPILLARVGSLCDLPVVRELIRAHEFYRMNGIFCDLVLINDYGSDYEQPLRERLQELISGTHLCALIGQKSGVYLLDGQNLTATQKELAEHAASLVIRSNSGTLSKQLRALLDSPFFFLRPLECLSASDSLPSVAPLRAFNGIGGFSEGGYVIGRFPTPAPWCNMLCNKTLGSMVSERGGGFIWYKNSRNGRITPFDNDPAQEGWGDVLLISTPDGRTYAPSVRTARCTHLAGASVFEGTCDEFSWRLVQFVDSEMPVKCHYLTLYARQDIELRILARVDFLLGVTRSDGQFTASGFDEGIQWARGRIGILAFAAFDGQNAQPENGLLTCRVSLRRNKQKSLDFLIGTGAGMDEIRELLALWHAAGGASVHLTETLRTWRERLSLIELHTPDPLMNRTVNEWLPYQALCARIWGRAGFYQAGGAFGFRDQLQDMLCMLLTRPEMVKNHLIVCAAHQFESGDVQHWWHPEQTGVRTRISDDLLFLPYVTAEYIETTQDFGILDVIVPFLTDVDIPEGHEDWYGDAETSQQSASLHEHCLRAIRRAMRYGKHGLLLMGTGDWNDGMNHVGHLGQGESVWLTEFMIVVLEKYAPLCDKHTQEEFSELAGRLREAVELHGWDGRWYRRAYMDDGTILGSEASTGGCRIDSLAQSWAVMAGLSRERVKRAMQEVERQLIDREHGIIRLLTPPFDTETVDPGYIRGYPPGIRENGGQYTHAACWVVMALAKLGQAEKAWDAFLMLMPWTHSDTEEKMLKYRVEPYVIAADIYGEEPHTGRGGWTWYTGAAGWMVRVAYEHLMGYRRHGRFATINALLPMKWDEVSMRLRVGTSTYTFTARRDCGSPLLDGQPLSPDGVPLVDDGKEHTAVFPVRSV